MGEKTQDFFQTFGDYYIGTFGNQGKDSKGLASWIGPIFCLFVAYCEISDIFSDSMDFLPVMAEVFCFIQSVHEI